MADNKTAIGFDPEISSGPRQTGINIEDSEGNVVDHIDYGTAGIAGMSETVYRYTGSDGKNAYTTDVLKLPTSISLDEKTGNISISAPKAVMESEEFGKIFDEDFLKQISQAYKLNPEYKISVMETKEGTTEKEEKQITIPEYISRLNNDLINYTSNLRSIRESRGRLRSRYGDKVDNLTDAQMAMWMQNPTSGIYIPDILFNVNFFGDDPSKGNPFKALVGKAGENGSYSLEDLKKIYNLSNFGRSEVAGVLAMIDGALRGSDWSKDTYYTDEDGNEVYNRNSANEAAKLLAFREYIIANHPEGEWYQQAGQSIEDFTYNAAYYTTRVFMNVGNDLQAVFTGGQGKEVQNAIKDVDQVMDTYNTENQLLIDSAQAMQFMGMVGGTLLGSWGVGKGVGLAAKGVAAGTGAAASALVSKLGVTTENLSKMAGLAEGSAAAEALSIGSMAALASEKNSISLGARVLIKSLTMAEKAALATNVAKAYLEGHAALNWAVSLLADTVHDAFLYDSATLRDALEASDQETRDYWLGQLADNTKWWVGMSFAKGALKFAGKTTLGKAADAIMTPLVNRIAANWGDRGQRFRDYMAGGSVVNKLEKQLENAKVGTQKYNRLARKLEIEEWNSITREARRALGNIDLDWNGLKLTEESLKKFQDLKTTVKALENGIDAYNRNISTKMDEMVRAQVDPVTGKMNYINPTLARANNKASKFYNDLTDLGKKYNLTPAKNSLISQEMIDYWVGTYQLGLMNSFAKRSVTNSADARSAAEMIAKNLKPLRESLPREIVNYIDEGVKGKIYQSWYKAQNEYGMSKGLLNRVKVSGYESNLIWQENGYMPVVVDFDARGRWLERTGRIDSVIEQDFEKIKFKVAEGQHYQDPELVRQSRLKNMAKAEVNAQIFKAYSGFGSNATNVTQITGEETEYVRKINENKKSLENTIATNASQQFKEGTVNISKVAKSRKRLANEPVDQTTMEAITAGMSPTQTADFLVGKKVLPNRNAKLTDGVTAENYAEWYAKQNNSVKKFLQEQKSGEPIKGKYGGLTAEDIDREIGDAKQRIKDLNTPKTVKNKLEQTEYKTSPKSDLNTQVKVLQEKQNIQQLEAIRGAKLPTFEDLQNMISTGGVDFEAGLQRAYLAGDASFAKTSVANEAARNLEAGKEAFYQGVLVAKIKGEMRNILKLDVDTTVESIYSLVKDQVGRYVRSVIKEPGARAVIDTLSEVSNGSEDVAKYYALKELSKKSNLDNAKESLHKVIDKEIGDLKKSLSGDNIELIYKKADEMLTGVVRAELDSATSVARTINPNLVDSKDIYAKVKSLGEKIESYEKAMDAPSGKNDYIMYLDNEGRQVYAQVDPAFASLFNYRHSIEVADAGALAKINALTSKVYRYGTTSVNLSSFGNQLFRDFGNALYVGGAFQTIKTNADNLVDVFGQDIIDQIKQFDPSGYEMRQIRELASATGQTVEEAAVSREMMKGSAMAASSTQATLYRKFMDEAYGDKTENQLTQMRSRLSQLADKYSPEELLNGKRENYLRRRVYASSFNDAMKSGYTLEQSRVFAEFAMNNATTNFARQLYHMQAIADSTPYFRAAINGTKSFWRMWSLDPVGISGRIMGGLILPVMALTAYSLSSEENKKIYSNIPEHNKADSLVFVFEGKPMSIPIPQEISNLVNPFRHFVEYLNVAQPNQFWELAMNDVLGICPYDLQGFTAIDYDSMISDPTFFDRVSRGVSRVFSAMAPVPIKSSYMLMTGIDPYSGKRLNSPRNNVIWNSETGETEVMDYNQNAFARWFANTFKDTGISANLAEKYLSSLFGTTGSNLIGDITALFSEGGEGFVKSVATNIGTQISKPFTVPEYDLTTAIWKRAVNEMTIRKEQLLNSNEFKTISSQLSQTTDPLERQKLIARQSNMFSSFQQDVGEMTKRLVNKYGGSMDRKKYAAVLNLLNFNSDAVYQSGTQASSDIATSAYYQGRNDAIHTMWELGIRGTEDASIFGYLYLNKETGKTELKYNSPIAIMDLKQQWYNQSDLNVANIESLLKRNNIKDAHNAIAKQISAIYDSKKKLTSQDRAKIEAIQINWNSQLAKTIAPYVAQMTPEAAINNTQVLNALYPYVEVPGSWEVNDKGKGVSLGERGNKKRAYYESWIKSMFGVNDKYKGQY